MASLLPVVLIGGGALAVVALVVSESSKKKPASGLPRQMTDEELKLQSPPLNYTDERNQLWIRYLGDPQRSGPSINTLINSMNPVRRKLNQLEWWALSPYFKNARDIDDAILNVGKSPPQAAERMLDNGWATTAAGADGKPEIWIRDVVVIMDLWWLGRLAHQLVHAQQMRDGARTELGRASEFLTNMIDTPEELAAIEMQQRVMSGLVGEARAYFAEQDAPAA